MLHAKHNTQFIITAPSSTSRDNLTKAICLWIRCHELNLNIRQYFFCFGLFFIQNTAWDVIISEININWHDPATAALHSYVLCSSLFIV